MIFTIKILNIDKLKLSNQKELFLIMGKASNPSYNGKLYCDDVEIEVMGEYPGDLTCQNVTLNVVTGAEFINDSFIGKIFTSEKWKTLFCSFLKSRLLPLYLERLTNGTFTKNDILLLNHEKLELELMREKGYTYEKAHNEANKKYYWAKEIKKENVGKI